MLERFSVCLWLMPDLSSFNPSDSSAFLIHSCIHCRLSGFHFCCIAGASVLPQQQTIHGVSVADFLSCGICLSIHFALCGTRSFGWAVGPGHQDNSRFFALYFVWQTGMAACIGFMLSKEFATTEASAEQSPTHEIERHLFGSALHVICAIFFLGVLCFLGWQYSRVVRGHLAFKQRQQAYRTYVAEAPSAENLPSISSLQ